MPTTNLTTVRLLEPWPAGSDRAVGDEIEVDPVRAAKLCELGIAEALDADTGAWRLRMTPDDYLARFGGAEDPSDEVLERLELARRLVGGES